jgi:Rap1a immunity proteins
MRRLSLGFCLLPLFLVVAPNTSRAAVTVDDFQLRNTGDLVALCSVTSADPMATAAIHFCQGFGVGVTRTLEQEDAADPSRRRMFCLTAGVTRNQATANFVRWANADPSRLSMPATDGVAAFLAAQYPCAGK